MNENSPASLHSTHNEATVMVSRIGGSREIRSNFLLKPRMPPKSFIMGTGTSDLSRSRSKKHQRNETSV